MRQVIALSGCLVLAGMYGSTVIGKMLPIAATLLPWIDSHFAVGSLTLARNAQDTVVLLRAVLAHPLMVGGHVVYTDARGWVEVSTTVGTMLQPWVIAVSIAAAWPAPAIRRTGAVCIAAILALGLLCVDMPMTLMAYVWDMFQAHYDPASVSPLLLWHDFMRTGGRLALGLALGVFALWVSRKR